MERSSAPQVGRVSGQPAAPAGHAADAHDAAFRVDGDVSLRRTNALATSDLYRAEYAFDAQLARCRYTTLGRPEYRAIWSTYTYRRGLAYETTTDEPSVALYFQLRGATERHVNGEDGVLEMLSGEANLVVVPPGEAASVTRRDTRGVAFDALLSKTYFLTLADRHPDLLGRFGDGLLAGRPDRLGPGSPRISPRMAAVIGRIEAYDGEGGAGSLMLESSLLELIALLVGESRRPVVPNGLRLTRADTERIHAARDLLLERLDDPPTLAELARHALMNEFKLKRGFKALFGDSPYAYFLAHRLELARSYLLDTDVSIAEIARRVGYRDPAHFTHAFRKRYGVRPSDLR